METEVSLYYSQKKKRHRILPQSVKSNARFITPHQKDSSKCYLLKRLSFKENKHFWSTSFRWEVNTETDPTKVKCQDEK